MPELDELGLTPGDREILSEIQRRFDHQLGEALDPIKRELKSVAQRSSRPPGVGLEHAALNAPATLSRQLADDTSFQHWLKSNKLQSSGFATELKMPPLSRKAAVMNVSPTEHVPLIYGQPAYALRLLSLLPQIPVSTGSIEYLEETAFTPNAGVAAEGSLKPSTSATYSERLAKSITIASTLKASVQAIGDLPQLSFWLDSRLTYAVLLKQEDCILNGDSASATQGLLAVAPPFVNTPLTSDNPMDLIARAIGALQAAGFAPDGVVLNPVDYTALRLLKNTVGSYLYLGTASTGPDDEELLEVPPLTWQVPTVLSPSMPQGKFLVGAFRQATIWFMREAATLQFAFQNEDDFLRNLICMRAELRGALAIPLPSGLLQGTLPVIATSGEATRGLFSGAPVGKK